MSPRQKNRSILVAAPRLLCAFLLFALSMFALISELAMHMLLSRMYHSLLRWLNDNYHYVQWLKRDLADCETILEIGCGSGSPLINIGYGQKTDAIDVWQPYVDRHNKAGGYHECQLVDVLEFNFPEKAYDAIVMLDVLEHLPNDRINAIDLFARMEKCARKKVIIFSPNGYIPNDEVDGNSYQAHLSAWHSADFKKRGYKVLGGTGFKPFFGKASLPKSPQIVFYLLGMLSQPLVYHFPSLAFHSYAVKELEC